METEICSHLRDDPPPKVYIPVGEDHKYKSNLYSSYVYIPDPFTIIPPLPRHFVPDAKRRNAQKMAGSLGVPLAHPPTTG